MEEGVRDALLGRPPEQRELDIELSRSRLIASMFGRAVHRPRVGRFELHEHLGRGGMGTVYLARDHQLERDVAVKVVDTRHVGATTRARALREARGLARLAHPNVVTVFEVGLHEEFVWFAMEYVAGETVRQWLQRAPRTASEILQVWIAAGRGLAAVHAAGLVHRDIKPSNVLIDDHGRVRLIDFGLVRESRSGRARSPARASEPIATPGTDGATTSAFVGTVAYAAPEQRRGEAVDALADQYSFCVSAWESLYGAPPEPRRDEVDPTRAGGRLHTRARRALARGMSIRPHDRFASLEALIDALEDAVATRRRSLRVLIGGGLLGALLTLIVTPATSTSDARASCVEEPPALAVAWSDARRQQLAGAFAGTGLPFADESAATVIDALDRWARRWSATRRGACVAAVDGLESEATLELRAACLDRRLREFAVIVDAFAAADASTVARASSLLAELPELGACAGVDPSDATYPLPTSPARREAILTAYDRISALRLLARRGALAQARAGAERLATSAEQLGYSPLSLAVKALPHELALDAPELDEAVPRLLEIIREAESMRLDELVAELRVRVATATAGRWSHPDRERWLVDDASAALRRLGWDKERRAVDLLRARARLEDHAGEQERALATLGAALTQAQAVDDDALAAAVRCDIGRELASLGRFGEAEAEYRAALRAGRADWGARSPFVANVEFDLGLLSLEQGRFDDATPHLERAASLYERAFGPRSHQRARVRFALAKLALSRGELPRARALVDDVLEVYARELGERHELVAEAEEASGVLHFFAGEFAASVAAYQRALAIRERVLDADHPAIARLHSNVGESLVALGEPEPARAAFARALTIYERVLPDDHPELALPLKGRGQLRLAAGDHGGAVDDLERALSLQVAAGSEPLEIADIRFSLARALAGAGAADRARSLAAQARADFERLGQPTRVVEITRWLARAPG